MEKVEYRVRPVVRWVVTRYRSNAGTNTAAVETLGEFDNEGYAEEVARKLGVADYFAPGDNPSEQSAEDQMRQSFLAQKAYGKQIVPNLRPA